MMTSVLGFKHHKKEDAANGAKYSPWKFELSRLDVETRVMVLDSSKANVRWFQGITKMELYHFVKFTHHLSNVFWSSKFRTIELHYNNTIIKVDPNVLHFAAYLRGIAVHT